MNQWILIPWIRGSYYAEDIDPRSTMQFTRVTSLRSLNLPATVIVKTALDNPQYNIVLQKIANVQI